MDLRLKNIQSAELPLLMGIMNITPDSFYDGGEYNRPRQAIERARSLVKAGADILDIGGESTRPGASPVEVKEEKNRVIPVIEAIRGEGIDQPISVDTSRAEVARTALEAGADWINDVWALGREAEMISVVAETKAPVVLMHMQGSPQTMQQNPAYESVVDDILSFFEERIEAAVKAGVGFEQIILDPGIGFGKKLEHNRKILSEINRFSRFGAPVLAGHSRKSYLGDLLDREKESRLAGTLATSGWLIEAGVDILRVHDVRQHYDLKKVREWLN